MKKSRWLLDNLFLEFLDTDFYKSGNHSTIDYETAMQRKNEALYEFSQEGMSQELSQYLMQLYADCAHSSVLEFTWDVDITGDVYEEYQSFVPIGRKYLHTLQSTDEFLPGEWRDACNSIWGCINTDRLDEAYWQSHTLAEHLKNTFGPEDIHGLRHYLSCTIASAYGMWWAGYSREALELFDSGIRAMGPAKNGDTLHYHVGLNRVVECMIQAYRMEPTEHRKRAVEGAIHHRNYAYLCETVECLSESFAMDYLLHKDFYGYPLS